MTGPPGGSADDRRPPGVRLAGVDEVEVTVEKLVAGGDGLARYEGAPIFVPRSAPGDRLRVRLTERRPDYGRAEIVEVLEPGPGRREPPCPFFARCGGCDLQHLEDEVQVRAKAAAVVETLVRIGGLQPPEDLRVIAGDSWAWRLRTQLHVEPEGGAGGRPAVGYFERGSHDLVAVDRCPILVPELERLVPELPALLARVAGEEAGQAGREAAGRVPRRLDLAAGDGGEVTAAPPVEGLAHGEVTVEVGRYGYRFDARCFFQGHRGLLPELVDAVLGSPEHTGESAFDLYCGVGLFTLPLAARYRRVIGVEGDRLAVRYARRNARLNGCDGVEIEGRAVESWIGLLPEGVDRVVADPPRTGLKGRVLDVLLDRAPRRITYVSCHPAALARDLKALKPSYDMESLALADLFPQTGHMEAIVQLKLAP